MTCMSLFKIRVSKPLEYLNTPSLIVVVFSFIVNEPGYTVYINLLSWSKLSNSIGVRVTIISNNSSPIPNSDKDTPRGGYINGKFILFSKLVGVNLNVFGEPVKFNSFCISLFAKA